MTNTKTNITRIVALILVTVTLLSVIPLQANAASWRTGNIPSNYRNSGYTTVYLNNTRSDAKIKIHTYYRSVTGASKEGKSRVYITMKDTSNRWIWGGSIDTGRNGKTMTLGKDHSAYRIYIREVKLNGIKYYDWSGYNRPVHWAIECTKNCYVN